MAKKQKYDGDFEAKAFEAMANDNFTKNSTNVNETNETITEKTDEQAVAGFMDNLFEEDEADAKELASIISDASVNHELTPDSIRQSLARISHNAQSTSENMAEIAHMLSKQLRDKVKTLVRINKSFKGTVDEQMVKEMNFIKLSIETIQRANAVPIELMRVNLALGKDARENTVVDEDVLLQMIEKRLPN